MSVILNGREATHLVSSGADGAVVKMADGTAATIPAGHADHAAALALPAGTLTPVVPEAVTNGQARAALRAAGHMTTVEAAIAAAAIGDPSVTYAWENSPMIRRDSLLVASLGAAVGLNAAQIDALFIAASQIDF